MLAGLRHHAFVGRDDQQREVDAADAGQHVLDEALVAGDVHDLDRQPVGRVEVGEAEVDRDAAGLLLRQAVGVDAGERLDQRRLAVVDVPGGADDDVMGAAHAPCGAGEHPEQLRHLPRQHRAAVEEQAIVHEPADDRRIAGPHRGVERARRGIGGAEGQPGRGQLHRGQRAAADLRAPLDDARGELLHHRCPQAAAQTPGARGDARQRLGETRQRRHRLPRRPRLVGGERRLQRGDRELVDPQGAIPAGSS